MEPLVTTPTYDAIIVGSGAGGAAAAYGLVNAGMRVMLIEKGDYLVKDACTLDVQSVVRDGVFKSREAWRDRHGRPIAPEEYFNVGGKTKWYGAALQRFSHEEFDANVPHQCLPWPFPYATLAPYYRAAEERLGLRQFGCEPDLQEILMRIERKSPTWTNEPLPLGLSGQILADRKEVSHFDGFASPADLKRDADTAFLASIRERDNFTMMTRATVTELLGDPRNPSQIIGVGLEGGQRLIGRSVLLAAGALHSPRLLQRYLEASGLSKTLPAYRSVGRNLKLQLRSAVIVGSLSKTSDVLRKTRWLVNLYLRRGSVQPLGFDGELLAGLFPKSIPRPVAHLLGTRAYGFLLQTEDGSHPDNRVYDETDGAGVVKGTPVLDYDCRRTPLASEEQGRLVSQFCNALRDIRSVVFSRRLDELGSGYASGTLIAGSNPETSVVSAIGAVHGMMSLYVADGSALPRSSRVGPALTIYAWSLRVADQVALALRN